MTLNMNQGIELQGLIARLRNEKVSIKTAYKFNKLITILEKELSFYNEELAKIIDQYAQKDKDGNPILSDDKTSIQIIKDKIDECQQKMEDLSSIEFEVKGVSFKIDELKERIGIKKTIREYGIEEQVFLATLDEMSEKAFDDQCTGANPRYPLISEIKDIYLKVYYGN